MEHLNALASICESAERMPVLHKPIVSYPSVAASLNQYFTASSSSTAPGTQKYPNHYYTSLCHYTTPLTFSTPPAATAGPSAANPQQQDEPNDRTISLIDYPLHCKRPMNPVIRNVISYASYVQYLDETWPEKCSRRGSAVIRASLYTQISDCLKGGAATARFRYWVKKSGFFLAEKLQPDGSYAACIAVPLNPSKLDHVTSRGTTRSYRLVAKLEEFVHLIGEYHNDSIGHYGIRKTYQMIQQDYTYLPRSAIAKFVQLCDVCSVRGKRTVNTKPKNAKKTTSSEEVAKPSSSENSIALNIVPPSPEDEVEIATESTSTTSVHSDATTSINSTNSKTVVESIAMQTVPLIDCREDVTTSISTESPLNEECAANNHSLSENSLSLPNTTASSDQPIELLSDQLHTSVKQLLEGLTWEEMLQLYSETTPILITPTSLESDKL